MSRSPTRLRSLLQAASLLAACSLFAAAAACGSDTPPGGPVPSMLIENQSQYQLRELRIHDTDDYREAENLLDALVEIDAELVYYGEGPLWVTVFREKFEGGPILAFTTAKALELARGQGYRLIVFDESFRLTGENYLDPEDAQVPILGDPDR